MDVQKAKVGLLGLMLDLYDLWPELKITEPTVKIHRGNIMHKLGVNSAAEMVRIADKLDIPIPKKIY